MMDRKLLKFSVKLLQILNLWPNKDDYIDNKWRLIKDISLVVSLMPCALPILADFLLQLYDGVQNLAALMENLIALNCIAGMIYMTVCFVKNRRLIQHLVASIGQLNRYGDNPNLIETDEKADLYAKLFLFYGIVGNVIYMIMPSLNKRKCEDNRLKQVVDDGVPCGLVTRCRFPFKFDYSPLFEIVFVHQFYTCSMVTVVILVLTMLLCGLVMHITNQLNYLQSFIRKLSQHQRILRQKVLFCVKYHTAIITYSNKMNEAFSTMMMLYISLTSLVISCLGFQILIVDNFYDSLRFALHLVGWLVLLLLVCYYGQVLIEESKAIAQDIYFIPWFQAPVTVQKDIYMMLIRAQKPLTLSANSMGVMSFPMFLRVISSAYSYFTLLWNIQP